MAERKLRKYELTYILHPEVSDEDRARVEERIQGVFDKAGAHILKREEWGKRKLAYEIEKVNKGIYYYVVFASYAEVPQEIERNLRMLDAVLRYLTIKLDDDISLEAARAEYAEEQAAKAARRRPLDEEEADTDDDDDDDVVPVTRARVVVEEEDDDA